MPVFAAFHEVRFPVDVAFGSTGGPERSTEIVTLSSGFEERNARWADSRRRYEAGYGIRTFDDLEAVIAFFEERRGRLYGFRFRDPLDWKSCLPSETPGAEDQHLGVGDGSTETFQLVKSYGSGATEYARTIRKPVGGSVRVAIDGVEKSEGNAFSLDAATGLITFSPAAVPASGSVITAGFAFDVPVRFDTDHLAINIAAFEAGSLPSVPLVEIRL